MKGTIIKDGSAYLPFPEENIMSFGERLKKHYLQSGDQWKFLNVLDSTKVIFKTILLWIVLWSIYHIYFIFTLETIMYHRYPNVKIEFTFHLNSTCDL